MVEDYEGREFVRIKSSAEITECEQRCALERATVRSGSSAFELATEEDAAVRNGDRYKFGANGRQSGQRLKIETAKLPFESTHFESLNLAVVLPGSPLVKLETPARWVNGGVMMARSNPDIMVMLNGEATGIEMKMDVRILAKAARPS